MAVNEWRGDAPAVAQETLLVPPLVPNRVDFWMGNPTNGYRALGYDAVWDGTGPSTAEIVTRWSGSNLPEFQEVIATPTQYNRDNGDTVTALLLKSKTPGVPFSVVATLAGSEFTNEVQLVNLLYSPTGGTWALSFDGQTTAGLAITATASQVQTALEALSNIAPGDVTVTGGNGAFRVQFGGAYASTDVPRLAPVYINTLTGGNLSIDVSTLVDGIVSVNEIQRLTASGSPTGGTFLVIIPGHPTVTLAWNSSSSGAQTAFNSAIGSGNVTVTGGPFPGTPLNVEFIGKLAAQDVGQMTTDSSGLTGPAPAISVANTTSGVAGTNAKYRLAIAPTPTAAFYGGTGNPAVPDSGGRTGFKWLIAISIGGIEWYSNLLDYTATNSQIKAALQDLHLYVNGTEGGNPPFPGAAGITVTGTLNNTWSSGYLEVEFVGQWASRPISLSALTATPGWHQTGYAAQNRDCTIITTVVSAGLAGTNKVQTLTQTGSPTGYFRLRFNGQTTIPIPYGSNATVIAQALAQLSTAGVSGAPSEPQRPAAFITATNPNPYNVFSFADNIVVGGGALGAAGVTLTYAGGGLQSSNAPSIEVIETGDVAVSTTQSGYVGVSEVQRVRILKPFPAAPDPRSGTWSLTYSGQTTVDLDHDATAGDVQTALEGLSNLAPGDVFVVGSSVTVGFNVIFRAGLGNVVSLSGDGADLDNGVLTVTTDVDGGQSIVQIRRKRSRGPWHGDDPLNWSLGHVLESGEQALFQFGSTGPRWGITWLSTWTMSPVDATRLICRNDLVDGQKVRVDSSGTLPTGLAAGTDYYVIRNRDDSIQLATTRGGTPIELSGGSGTHRVFVRCAGIKSRATWSGWGGTLRTNENRYVEYRPLYWSLGFVDGSRVTLGEGSGGSGSPLFRLNSHDFRIILEVLATQGSKETTLPAVLWLGENAANVVELIDGELGIGVLRDETAELASLVVRSGECQLGGAVTVDSVDVTGGNLKTLSAPAVKLWIRGA